MKILYVTTISNTINAFLIPHINMLTNLGHQVDIACNIVQPIKEELLDRKCGVFNLEFQRSPLKKENLLAYKKLKNLVQTNDYDIVHTHTPIASFITRLACKDIKEIKVFYTAHGFHFYKGAKLINWLVYYPIEKWLSRYTDTLITINKEDYDRAKKSKFKTNKTILMNGVGINLDKFTPQTQEKKFALRKEYGYKKDDFILIYVGELNANKNQNLIIEVADKLKNKIPNLKLLLVGTGILEEHYKSEVKNLNLQNQVEFLGYRNDVNKLMALSDISVSASKREGLPVNIMEAMATGLPVIVTDCRGNRDLVEHECNGYVIDEIKEVIEAIEKLNTSKSLREQFANNSLKLVQKYKIEKILKELEKLY